MYRNAELNIAFVTGGFFAYAIILDNLAMRMGL